MPQREVVRRLATACTEQLDEVSAAAISVAVIGATTGALDVLLDHADGRLSPAEVQSLLQRALQVALAP